MTTPADPPATVKLTRDQLRREKQDAGKASEPPAPERAGKGRWEWRMISKDNRAHYDCPTRAVAVENAEWANAHMVEVLSGGPYPLAYQQYPWRVERRWVGVWEGDTDEGREEARAEAEGTAGR